jgi:hypothetical protein
VCKDVGVVRPGSPSLKSGQLWSQRRKSWPPCGPGAIRSRSLPLPPYALITPPACAD